MIRGEMLKARGALVVVLVAVCLAVVPGGCERPQQQGQNSVPQASISVYFSPRGGCTEAVVAAIAQAKRTLDVQAYSFTSVPIAEAIAKAHERGVRVRAVLDKSQRTERYTSATYLLNHSVPVFIDDAHAIAHNKVMIIDGETVITGSFNFTKAAEQSNAENLLIIRGDVGLAQVYAGNFDVHLAHAKPYTGAEKGGRTSGTEAPVD